MINYGLPIEVEIGNKIYKINKNGDFRMVLDVLTILDDKEFGSENVQILTALNVFYNFNIPDSVDDVNIAVEKMYEFIQMGEKKEQKNNPMKLMDWEQDFNLYIPPINKILGKEVRSLDYMHWWTFMGAYMEIPGDSTFSNVITIRKKLKTGKKLDVGEKEFYSKNRDLIDLKQKLSIEDEGWLFGGD